LRSTWWRAITPRSVAWRRGHAMRDGQIGALDRMVGKLPGEPLMRSVGLGDHEKARRVLVDAVNDARAGHPANARQSPRAMMQQRIDQRAVDCPRRGGRPARRACPPRSGARLHRRWRGNILRHRVERAVWGRVMTKGWPSFTLAEPLVARLPLTVTRLRPARP
jgi:hypothetical protein